MDLSKRHPPSLSPRALAIAGWVAFGLAGALFLAIAWQVSGAGALLALDERVSAWAQAHQRPGLVAFLLVVTHLNSTVAISVWSVVFGVILARLRERYWLLTLACAVPGALLLNLLLKGAYERVRPRFEPPLLELHSSSFPSGHTAAAVAFYGVLAAFLVSRFFARGRRAACVAGAISAVALVGFSRVYLGAHHLSDVVAAACSSTAWLVLCLAGGHALVRGKLRPRWLLLGALALVAATVAVFLPLEDWSDRFVELVSGMTLPTALLVFCAVYVVATLILVPAWILLVAAGAVFGLKWGLAAALASTVAAALAAFALGRYALRRFVEPAARRSASFKAMDAAVAKEGWKVVALMRLSPLMPSGVKSYLLGLTRIRLGAYLAASLAGMCPGIVLKVYVGAAGRGAISEGGALNWVLFALGLAATVALALLLGRRARRRLSPFLP